MSVGADAEQCARCNQRCVSLVCCIIWVHSLRSCPLAHASRSQSLKSCQVQSCQAYLAQAQQATQSESCGHAKCWILEVACWEFDNGNGCMWLLQLLECVANGRMLHRTDAAGSIRCARCVLRCSVWIFSWFFCAAKSSPCCWRFLTHFLIQIARLLTIFLFAGAQHLQHAWLHEKILIKIQVCLLVYLFIFLLCLSRISL